MREPQTYLREPSFTIADLALHIDELSLWSAPFGLRLLEQVPMLAEGKVLDVGTGTGYMATELAERYGPATSVYALDTWKEGLETLQRKLDFRHLTNVSILHADGNAMPLPSNSIDLILCCLGINNFADPAAVLRECHRVAKTQATLLVATNLVGHMSEFYDVFREVIASSCSAELLPNFDVHVAHRGTTDSMARLLQSSGFAVTEVQVDSFSMRFANAAALFHHTLIQFGFLPAGKELVPVDQRPRVFQLLEQRLDEIAERTGELTLTIPIGVFRGSKLHD